ncbi:hypothetical protein LG307_14840 [Sutcliffiella horikoshii]|uniref:hypothetical protein n=1 Tax=Sutcliffiella horikoshii TaxID=79883 RepID=UPI003850CE30
MDKKTIWIIIFCVGSLLIIFPILTNTLMFIKTIPVAGDESVWIGYIGTFGGAILGGVISGALTLIGVKLTIRDSEKIRALNEYPKKINSLENLITAIEENLIELEKFTRVKDPFDINSKDELQLFWIDHNLQLQATEEYKKLTSEFLKRIKEDVLHIDSKGYREFFILRNKLDGIKNTFSTNEKLNELWHEAQDYFLHHYDPLMTWKDYAEKIKKDEYNEIYTEITRDEYKLIFDIYELFSNFKVQAEIQQLELLKAIEK